MEGAVQARGQDLPATLVRRSQEPGGGRAVPSQDFAQGATNGTTAQPWSLELSGYVLASTSLPATYSASQVLQLYRCRWQIELAFKRFKKSLLGMGHVPKSDDQSARAWMQAKIPRRAPLIDRLLIEAQDFFPLGIPLARLWPMAAGVGGA